MADILVLFRRWMRQQFTDDLASINWLVQEGGLTPDKAIKCHKIFLCWRDDPMPEHGGI